MNNSPYRKLIEQSRSTVDGDSNWLITMADVMTLLMVFFVMFLIARQAENGSRPAAGNSAAVKPSADIPAVSDSKAENGIKDAIALGIRQLGMEKDVEIYTENKDVVITLRENITFTPGKAVIFDGAGSLIGRIADSIQKNPSYIVEIDGNTDNIPIHTSRYPSNWELSVARAASVLKCFVDKYGADPSRFYIRGNADRKPLVSNDSPEERALNRRVEIRLKYIPESRDN
ncbi:MAG: OmpA family protein [Nitrospirae bacterium]|nr:OmpA family protein [Nitrospirota bacterium]